MSKLKTLEDFDYEGLDGANILKDALGKEAIKWVKALERGFKPNSNYNSEGNPFLALAFELSNDGLVDWIKCFFDIRKEDLNG